MIAVAISGIDCAVYIGHIPKFTMIESQAASSPRQLAEPAVSQGR